MIANTGAGEWAEEEEWRLESELVVESLDSQPETLFSNELIAIFGREGVSDIYVRDLQSAEFRQFSGNGEYVATVGSLGDGPGELRVPVAAGWSPDEELWVANAFNGRYTVFDRTGNFVRTIPRALRGTMRLHHRLRFIDRRTFLDQAYVSRGARRGQGLFIVDTVGTVVDTLPPILAPHITDESLVARNLGRAGDYFPRLVWAFDSDTTLWFANSLRMTLFHRHINGDTLRIITTDHRDAGLGGQEREMIERDLRRGGFDPADFAFGKPVVQGIYPLPDGHLLVQVEQEPEEGGSELDVFAPDGNFLGTVEGDPPLNHEGLALVRGDTLISTARDALGVAEVFRYIVRRPN